MRPGPRGRRYGRGSLVRRRFCWSWLPASDGQPLTLWDLLEGDAAHRRSETLGHFRDDRRIVEVGGRLDDRASRAGGILALEDARAHEDALGPQLHRERGVRR